MYPGNHKRLISNQRNSSSTSATIADAGRNRSSVTFLLMAAVNLAVSGSPTSLAWLCLKNTLTGILRTIMITCY